MAQPKLGKSRAPLALAFGLLAIAAMVTAVGLAASGDNRVKIPPPVAKPVAPPAPAPAPATP